MKKLFFAASIVTGLFCLGTCTADDWPQFRGPHRDGRSETTDIRGDWFRREPPLLSVIQGAGKGYASLCVVGKLVYTTGNSDSGQFVNCLDLDSKSLLWSRELVGVLPNHAAMGSRSTPTCDGDLLFVTSSDGQVYCLDRKTDGKILWKKSFQKEFQGRLMSGWGYAESPLVDGDRVVVTPGGGDAMVVCLEKLTGKEIWRCRVDENAKIKNQAGEKLNPGAGYASMIKIESNAFKPQYVQLVGQGLIGIDCETGQIVWSHSRSANRKSNIVTPLFSSNHIVYSSSPNGGISFLRLQPIPEGGVRMNAIKVHKSGSLDCHHGGMVLHKGHVYYGAGENKGYPTCIDLMSGEKKWGGAFRGPGRGSAAVVAVEDKIIFRYQNGVVAMILADPNEYKPLGHFKQSLPSDNQSWSHPVVVGQKLLIREQDSIMVYDLR